MRETKAGEDWNRDRQKYVILRQTVDHENDRYFKHVEDIEAGEILRHVDYPLSEHMGHGSAKLRKP